LFFFGGCVRYDYLPGWKTLIEGSWKDFLMSAGDNIGKSLMKNSGRSSDQKNDRKQKMNEFLGRLKIETSLTPMLSGKGGK